AADPPGRGPRAGVSAGCRCPCLCRRPERSWRSPPYVLIMPRMHAFAAEVAGEDAALADGAVDRQPGLVQAQHVLDDGQAQPGTAAFARAAAGDAVEAFGQPRDVLGRDARA